MTETYVYREHRRRPDDPWPMGNWCLHCRAFDDEPPKPECKNPDWHTPTWREPRVPREEG